jgi:hypothetical protein
MEKVFNQPTTLRAVASLRSLISWGVSGTMQSSRSVMCFWSCWITSSSWVTYCGRWSSIFTSMTITECSAWWILSWTSSFSTRNYAFSSSHFTFRVIFFHSASFCCYRSALCACIKVWVACVVSSWAHRRWALTLSVIWSNWVGSSPVPVVPIVKGTVETARLD